MNAHTTSSASSRKTLQSESQADLEHHASNLTHGYGSLHSKRKASIAELANDHQALEDWHRNMARIRADSQH